MKQLKLFLLAALLILPAISEAAPAPENMGTFTTDFNDMVLYRDGNRITGTYAYRDGRIEGTLNGHTLTGRWTQSNAKGRIVFVFNDDFSSFTGKWGYNDAEPNGKWNGQLKAGTRSSTPSASPASSPVPAASPGVFSTDFNDMKFNVDGNRVTGTYAYRNGRIEGTLNGHTLTGRWTQDNAKGRLIFVFNDDFTAFTGKWSYNDAEPNGKWDGKLKPGTGSGLMTQTQPAPAKVSLSTGTFATDFNDMIFHLDGNKVTGTYAYRNGRIEGTLNGHTLTGRWTQDNAKGRLVFVFNDDFTAFTGKWSYNDAEPNGKWDGKLKPGTGSGLMAENKPAPAKATLSSRTFATDFNDMVFHLDGNKVTGTYAYRNGRIEGTLNGHTLTGRWTQDNAKGRLVFVFNDNFTAFTGKWSYNDAEPNGKWDGKVK